jgi:YbbR domain-containing protein
MMSFLRQLVLHDLWLKLFSLALAGLIWITVFFALTKKVTPATIVGQLTSERTIASLPVVLISSTADVHRYTVQPKEVSVTVQGDRRTLEALQQRDISVLVDLTGIGGRGELLEKVKVSTPAGVTHVRIEPSQVQVIAPAEDETTEQPGNSASHGEK